MGERDSGFEVGHYSSSAENDQSDQRNWFSVGFYSNPFDNAKIHQADQFSHSDAREVPTPKQEASK